MGPAVSIVLPLYNDEEFVASAIESCLAQTMSNFEVVCVDDCSTDHTCAIVERYLSDRRIRLLHHEVSSSPFQARRTGIEAARAPFVLFLDGDDELAREAASTTLQIASSSGADLVGFGVEIVTAGGRGAPRLERSLQPLRAELMGDAILPALFPVGASAHGHLWRYLFGTELLLQAYSRLPRNLALYRTGDLPIAFLAAAAATKYVTTPEKLYRYFIHREASGNTIVETDDLQSLLGAVDSIESIAASARDLAEHAEVPSIVQSCYSSVRLSIVGNMLKYCAQHPSGAIQIECLARLRGRVTELDILQAAADHCREALTLLSQNTPPKPALHPGEAHNVLLTTHNLAAGGVQAAVAAQAHHLSAAGLDVTIALHTNHDIAHEIPSEVRIIEITARTPSQKLSYLADICKSLHIDAIIDHHILYDEFWPFAALTAREVGVPTIGWIHDFALRPLFDGTTRTSFLLDNMATLSKVVVLSPTDVAFWKLHGVPNVYYLPNAPSPILADLQIRDVPRKLSRSRLELVWWGRLQQSAKQVHDLLKVAAELRTQNVDFRLTIIGPNSQDLTADELQEAAAKVGISDAISLPGPLDGKKLLNALSRADVAVMTSAIEGYPMSLIEAQALGLPVVMYELPWLAFLTDNPGVFAAPQGDPATLAQHIVWLSNPKRYMQASGAALAAARRTLTIDFEQLYRRLLASQLPPEFSPAPTTENAALLLKVSNRFMDRNTRALRRTQARIRLLESQLSDRQPVDDPSFSVRDSALVARLRPILLRLYRIAPWLRPTGKRLKHNLPAALTQRRRP